MKVVQINATCGVGSTGKICVDISKLLTERGIENYILFSSKTNGYDLGIRCSNKRYVRFQSVKSRLLGNYGFNSHKATRVMIEKLEQIQPDIVHLHNIHGHDCNLEMLFMYFKRKKQRIIWTFHDCWAFTAYCPHFSMVQCNRWKSGCKDCPQYRNHSVFLDNSAMIYKKKRYLFEGLNLTIVTPSEWLAGLVKESFLGSYPVQVINNGIDLGIFKPTESDFRSKYCIPQGKKVLLGVAFDWGMRKGLDVFIELAKRLDPQQYQIVMVGTNEEIDRQLPSSIISIHRTYNQEELAEIYTAADLFVNPTREEVFGLVNLEALACGTPVITFPSGGSPECIDEKTGVVLDDKNLSSLVNEIEQVCNNCTFLSDDFVRRAKQFDKNLKYEEYLLLYQQN